MYDCRNRLIRTGDTTYEYDAENNRTAVTTDDSGLYYMRTTVLYQIEDNVYTSQVYSLKEGKSGDRLSKEGEHMEFVFLIIGSLIIAIVVDIFEDIIVGYSIFFNKVCTPAEILWFEQCGDK